MKEIADFTLRHAEDYDLLNDAITILFSVFYSFVAQLQAVKFFHEICGFKLLTKIMAANVKNEVVWIKALGLIIDLFANSDALVINKQEITRLFVESGGVEAINDTLREQTKSVDVVKLCVRVFLEITSGQGKAQGFSSFFQICFFFSWTIGVEERIDFDALEKAFELHVEILFELNHARNFYDLKPKNSNNITKPFNH